MEAAVYQLLQVRRGPRVAEQALGRHDHEGLRCPGHVTGRSRCRPDPLGLPADQVEVLGSRGAVGDTDVVAGGELEEPLEAGAGVLRTLAFESMRQEQD